MMLDRYALLKVMREVLGSAASAYSVNETARQAGVSVFAAKQGLDYLYAKNMVLLEKIGTAYQYKANLDNFLTRQWKVLFTLEEIGKAKIVEKILNTKKSIFSILLYGSASIGRDDENSDLDILVVADTDERGKKEMAALSSGTRREINISVYTPTEWKRKAASDKIFYEKVLIDSIALYGQKPVVL